MKGRVVCLFNITFQQHPWPSKNQVQVDEGEKFAFVLHNISAILELLIEASDEFENIRLS